MEHTTIFHRSRVLLAAVTALVFLTAGKTRGAPGDLDSTFGTSGRVKTDFSGNVELGNASAVQSDGRIVVAGFTRAGSDQNTEDFALARYNVDGALDSTFGMGGRVKAGFSSTADRANAVAIQSDGKIIAAGSSEGFVALIRFKPNGSIDPTFGTFGDGIVRTNVIGGGTSQVNGIAIQSDGKIVVAGRAGDSSANTIDFAVLRYRTDGTLDPNFGAGGGTNIDFFSGNDAAFAFVIQPNGKIVAAGSASRGDATSPDFALVRLNSNGNLDGTFGAGGKTTTDFDASLDGIYGIALQPDGKIVAAGFTFIASENNDNFALARYRTDGKLDPGFGNGGKVVTDFSPTTDEAHAVIVQPDGRIVAGGIAEVTGNGLDFALARYTAGGALDGDFGAGGKRTTAFSTGADFVNALVLQPGNKLVAVGGSGSDIALARYLTGLPGASGKLLNISTRLRVLREDKALIGGFIITGTEAKKVIIRALGPSLTDSGVSGALQDPTLELFGEQGSIALNDNWKQDQEAAIKATGIPPSRAAEAAVVRTLAPGNYTAVVRGKNDSVGVGLVEVYDLAQGAESELANISSRGFVDTGDNALIGGFIVGGGTRVVVRALGPSLGDQGVSGALADPTLALVDGNGSTVRANDNWKSDQEAALKAIGIQPTKDAEAAMIATLPAGSYTAIVRGKNNTAGVGLVEVYNIQ